MKITRDNYEMVMFDLLEGNLSDKQAIHVMGQIEEDEFLFKEWKLFKSTILIADKDVVYTNKAALLKDEDAVALPMWKSPWMAVAASLTILAVAFFSFNRSGEEGESGLASNNVVEEVVPVADSESEDAKAVVDVKEEEQESEKIVAPYRPQTIYTPPQFVSNLVNAGVKEELEKQIATPVFELSTKVDQGQAAKQKNINRVNQPQEKDVAQPALVADNSLDLLDKKEVEQLYDAASLIVDNSTQRIRVLEKFESIVTSDPKERITDRISGIVSMFKNPSLQIKPHLKGRPSLDIEFESEGYQAFASIQPFKNNN